MSLKAIVCANCGAQYRIPETFKAPQAKCKKCGATIEVNATTAAAKPRSSTAASKPKSTSSERPRRSTAGGRSASSRRGGDSGSRRSDRPSSEAGSRRSSGSRTSSRVRSSGTGRRGRRDSEEAETKKSRTPLIAGIVGLAAVVIVVVILIMSGGNAATDETPVANNGTADGAPAADDTSTETPPAPAATEPEGAAPEATGDEAAAAEAAAAKAAEAAAAKSKKTKKELTSVDDIFKPKVDLVDVSYSADVSEEEQKEIEALLVEVKDGGLAGIRAKRKLEQMEYKPIAGIVNTLRQLDYTNSSDSQTAYELNRLLSTIAFGVMNADFRPQPAGEAISLEDADWNGKTVKVWQQFHARYGNVEGYEKLRASRAKQMKNR